MKMVNRLIEPSSGDIFIDGRNTRDVDPVLLRRSLGYVIQQIGLFPNKTVEDNICIVPDILGWEKAKSRKRAAELLEMVALDPASFLKRYPKELSGGQQQRIGVLRAIAADPPVLLMDEPFGAIDPINRSVIQDEFLKLQRALRKTIMFVSHDIDEAVKMADRIAIFRAGRLVQYDTRITFLPIRPTRSFRISLRRSHSEAPPAPQGRRRHARRSAAGTSGGFARRGEKADGGAWPFGARHGRTARPGARLR